MALAAVVAVGFSLLGFWVRPWGDHPKYEVVSEYLDRHTSATDRIFVWGHMPEIYWAADRRPASRFITSGFPVGDWGSRPEGDEASNVPTPGALRVDDGGAAGEPSELRARHDAGRVPRIAVLTDVGVPRAPPLRRRALRVRPHHRRHRDLREPRTRAALEKR